MPLGVLGFVKKPGLMIKAVETRRLLLFEGGIKLGVGF